MSTDKKTTAATLLARAGHFLDEATGAIVPPLHLSSTYARDADYQLRDQRLYGRDDNPVFEQAESILRQLDGGADAALFSSGMAAASAVIATLNPGDQVVLAGAAARVLARASGSPVSKVCKPKPTRLASRSSQWRTPK